NKHDRADRYGCVDDISEELLKISSLKGIYERRAAVRGGRRCRRCLVVIPGGLGRRKTPFARTTAACHLITSLVGRARLGAAIRRRRAGLRMRHADEQACAQEHANEEYRSRAEDGGR